MKERPTASQAHIVTGTEQAGSIRRPVNTYRSGSQHLPIRRGEALAHTGQQVVEVKGFEKEVLNRQVMGNGLYSGQSTEDDNRSVMLRPCSIGRDKCLTAMRAVLEWEMYLACGWQWVWLSVV
jgi:hypothetical protein